MAAPIRTKRDRLFNSIPEDDSSPIDHSGGGVQILYGDIFYSPNSRRTVRRPLEYPEVPSRKSDQHCFTEWYEPQWWQARVPYLGFIPLRPVYSAAPFSDLLNMRAYFPWYRGSYSVDVKYLLGWARLQKLLKDAIKMLLRHHSVNEVLWVSRTAVGCRGQYKDLEGARSALRNTVRWFSQWMAALSYAIAKGKTLENESVDEVFPSWFSFLSKQQYSQVWLSALKSSQVDTFSPSVERVGVFLQLLLASRGMARVQPSVDWLCKYHVPVWYPWGDKESRASHLARFAPPSYQLQQATTFLTKTPTSSEEWSIPQRSSSPQPSSSMQMSSSMQPSSLTQGFDCAASTATIASWKEFFEKRRVRNEQSMARETPKQRQAREDRQKNPPVKRTKVFIWSRIEGGGYCRQSFYQVANGEHLDSYGKNQKKYDSFANEWDCFEEFGERSPDDMDDDDDDYMDDGIGDMDHDDDDDSIRGTYPSVARHPAATDRDALGESSQHPDDLTDAETFLEPEDRSYKPDAPVDGPEFDWEEMETAQILYEFLGFVAPLPLPKRQSTLKETDRTLVTKIVGLTRRDVAYFESPVADFGAIFLNSIKINGTPLNSSWDIATGNRLSFVGSKMFQRMSVIKHEVEPTANKGKGKQRDDDDDLDHDNDDKDKDKDKAKIERWHIFDFKESATVPWKIAVRNVVDALYICRLDRPGARPYLDFEVARQLLNRGIQFYTLLPVRPMAPYAGPPIYSPERLRNYRFSLDDYHAYERDRATLLSNPRVARAALLRGGIAWRLAVATMSFDDVLEGPTTAATLLRRGIILKTPDDSVDFCDDGLSRVELDNLSGTYRVPDEHGSGYALKSWWPTDNTWQQFSQYTRWTGIANTEFDTRLKEIQAGKAQPLTARQWRIKLRGSSATRRISSVVEDMSNSFVDANLSV